MGELVLGIETSNPSAGGAGVAMVRAGGDAARPWAGEVLGRVLVDDGGAGRHGDGLMAAIDRVVALSGVERGSIGRVAVSAGPGGFTGLRVACVTGQMLAMALGAGAVRVPTVAAVVAGLLDRGVVRDGEAVAVVLASKGERAFAGVMRATGAGVARGDVLGEGHVDAAGFASLLSAHGVGTVAVDRFVPGAFVAAAAERGARVVEPVYDAALVAGLGGVMGVVEAGALVPMYAREPEAVRLLRGRGG